MTAGAVTAVEVGTMRHKFTVPAGCAAEACKAAGVPLPGSWVTTAALIHNDDGTETLCFAGMPVDVAEALEHAVIAVGGHKVRVD
jgi:hypothetical protein